MKTPSSVMALAVADAAGTYSNIGYLGQAYDLVKGNPRPTNGLPEDPGWKPNSVFGTVPAFIIHRQPSC